MTMIRGPKTPYGITPGSKRQLVDTVDELRSDTEPPIVLKLPFKLPWRKEIDKPPLIDKGGKKEGTYRTGVVPIEIYSPENVDHAVYEMLSDMARDGFNVRYVPRRQLEARHGKGVLAYEDGRNIAYIVDTKDVKDSERRERAEAIAHEYSALRRRRLVDPGMDHMEPSTHEQIYRDGRTLLREYLSRTAMERRSEKNAAGKDSIDRLPVADAFRRVA